MVPNYANEGEGRFVLVTSDAAGPDAWFEGRFVGTLVRFERMDGILDPDDTVEMELYFDVTAQREEFVPDWLGHGIADVCLIALRGALDRLVS